MTRLIKPLVVIPLLWAGTAFAHAKMLSTLPADGDFVSAPESLVLEFDGPVTLTSAELKTVDGENRDVGDFPAAPATSFSVRVPQKLPAGEYYLVWKCVAADSHFSTGEFFFTVVAD